MRQWSQRQDLPDEVNLLNKPSAFLPVVMSITALAVVLGYAAWFGIARQTDEGAAAHVWQILMAGQIPLIVFFAIKWIPGRRSRGVVVLALQVSAAVAAIFPVWWFGW